MAKIKNLSELNNTKKISFHKGKIYAYDGAGFFQNSLHDNVSESFDFAQDVTSELVVFKNDVLAYIEKNFLKVFQLKKNTNLINLICSPTLPVTSLALSPSSVHTILGYRDGSIQILNNISGSSIIKFPLFSNDEAASYVDFTEENVVMAATKKNIILVDILERGAIAKITAKGIITNIITSKDKIVYATREKDIYFVDISELSNITTTRIATIDDTIITLSFDLNDDSIFALTNDKLINVDFESNIQEISTEFHDATDMAVVSQNSLLVATQESAMLVTELNGTEEDTPLQNSSKKAAPRDKNIIRFLTVDDSATIRVVIKRAIMNNFDKVEVYEAEDGIEAMNFLEKDSDIDVMLLDWNMPRMNGKEVVEAIHTKENLKHMKIIMATTEGSKDRVKEMLSKGVKGYLVKPFQPKSVVPMIEKLIQLVRSER